MSGYMAYCRAGFEGELVKELQQEASAAGVLGYAQTQKDGGLVHYQAVDNSSMQSQLQSLSVHRLVFARQLWVHWQTLDELDVSDRISPILAACEGLPVCGELRVEYPDTTEGRELSRFCRKFTVPLRQALRGKGVLTKKEQASKPVLFAFFTHSRQVHLGVGLPENISPEPLGILRLKSPSEAPSRSTLKLDEALQLFLTSAERDQRLQPGMHGVDLGACPGGWTYQLVRRGIFVQAVDNGAMADSLMETGLVQHYSADGFKYEPRKKPVNWLVCDMVESPLRVARLMAQWLERRWCQEAIFNLKLPMKKRYESVTEARELIAEILAGHEYRLSIKHLYHDREEVTCHLSSR
ncbi:23S rRNA (cytidine(2498)-2'-O)-methyltransferase [Saliniradius amylolyticus]|uniref:Ribosomal RNA large subunit methyltransferase M n=1 Tax=Saliniradius amylolyticus TaxID=2183582 RepID=A0A2S2E1I6_9ALTE|nr:23S rRNA (cytidine(2498)-2'-O)-methyltransferase RlmM [Saliniradius amylolyticus]AWL11511.1 23S rRNA (cytidine(2498)-2'-O)-methyltransferase [Saliniradius amylolyticus]